MGSQKTVAIVALTLVLGLSAFVIPNVIASTGEAQIDRVTLETNETYQPTEGLIVTVTDASTSESVVDVVDNDTGTVETLTIATGNTSNYTLPGGDGNITVTSATNNRATLEISYSPTYGFSDGAKFFTEHMGLFLVIMVFVIVVGGMTVVIQ